MNVPEEVRVGQWGLAGILDVPRDCLALIIFAHGSGSSRLSPRNRLVASMLRQQGLGTLLFDLLKPTEAFEQEKVFDIALLATRLCDAMDWTLRRAELASLPLGLFGASTGAAAALNAATLRPQRVAAVVSRGGRPDLATVKMAQLRAPTLLIVGSEDQEVLRLNQAACRSMGCIKRIEIVPGATHLFEEAGALERVAALAARWFLDHLALQETS